VGIGAAIVADGEAAKAMKPCEGALDHPSIPTEAVFGFDAFACNAIKDAPRATGTPTPLRIVPLIAMQLCWSLTRRTTPRPNRRHRIDHVREHLRIVDVGGRQRDGERHTVAIDDQVMLAARPATIGRIGPGFLAPLFAGT